MLPRYMWVYLLRDTKSVTRCWSKRSPNFTISSLKTSSFYIKGMFFKIAQNINKYLGTFNEKLCLQNLSKITQSGHTASLFLSLSLCKACKRETEVYSWSECGEWQNCVVKSCIVYLFLPTCTYLSESERLFERVIGWYNERNVE